MIGLNGIPKLSGISASSILKGALGQLESAIWDLLSVSPKWGIYQDDEVAVEVDSFMSVEHQAFADVPTYRMMGGAFASYNKISMPIAHRVVMAVGGDQAAREKFIAWLDVQREKPGVFDVVTPEKTFRSVTLTDYNINRSVQNGTAARIVAECTFLEIRDATTTLYTDGDEKADTSNAAQEADKPTEQAGFVQTVAYKAKSAVDSVKNKVSDVVGKYEKLKSGVTGLLNG